MTCKVELSFAKKLHAHGKHKLDYESGNLNNYKWRNVYYLCQ